ncbi:hypothetical protein FKP32DRAFT_1672469 [Trametes sanguinea]|nr:hypothetical protein FKP32DRAFT_1672469 [Trametes sanguinea]
MSSPPTYNDANATMLVRLVVWTKDNCIPEATYVLCNVGESVQLAKLEWLGQRVAGMPHTAMDVWRCDEGDWQRERVKNMVAQVTRTTTTFLLRRPEVGHCLGLGREVQLLEDMTRGVSAMCKPEIVTLDGREKGRVITIYAWSSDCQAEPRGFKVEVGKSATFRLSDYPDLAHLCVGDVEHDGPEGRFANHFERWNTSRDAWQLEGARDGLSLGDTCATLLLRHCDNRQPLALGYHLAQADEHRLEHLLKGATVPTAKGQRVPSDDVVYIISSDDVSDSVIL